MACWPNCCDGDPRQLCAFADECAGADGEAVTKRKNLKNLVDKGGFGDHPSTPGPLLKAGSVSRRQGIGEAAFALPTDAAKLHLLLSSGGMSGGTQEEAANWADPQRDAAVRRPV